MAGFSDKAYEEAGVSVVSTAKALWAGRCHYQGTNLKIRAGILDKSKTLSFFLARPE